MKKSVLFILVVSIITSSQANAQGGLLKKVSKSMTNELLGRSDKSSNKAKDQPSFIPLNAPWNFPMGVRAALRITASFSLLMVFSCGYAAIIQ